ncbi:hypothetical protein KJ940_17250 [Myxococcota bacterium]|nr:hypothetical protein [Myxococcota bacterium]
MFKLLVLIGCFISWSASIAQPLPSKKSWWSRDRVYRSYRNQLLPKTDRGFDVNASYKNEKMVNLLLEEYHKRYPDVTRLHNLGKSHQDRSILALQVSKRIEKNTNKPSILIVGAIHGDELLAIDYVFDAIQHILEQIDHPKVQNYLESLDLWFIPLANPDGNYVTLEVNRTWQRGRKNGRDCNQDHKYDVLHEGVDINRNFPFRWGALGERGSKSDSKSDYFRGESSASEPETRILMNLAEDCRFVAALSWHTNGRMILSPYTIEGVKNPKPDVAWEIAQILRDSTMLPNNNKGFRVKRQMYPVDGTEQDWYYHKYGTLAYIIEGTHHNPLNVSVRKRSIMSLRPIVWALFDRILQGPAVYGYIKKDGEPVEAIFEIEEVKMRSGECWTSRPSDGRFEQHLPNAGRYTLIIKNQTKILKKLEFKVNNERVRIDVNL